MVHTPRYQRLARLSGGLAEKIFRREMGSFDTWGGEPFTRFWQIFHTA